MHSYSFPVTDQVQITPTPVSGKIRLSPNTAIFYAIGSDPKIIPRRSAMLRGGVILQLEVPENSYIAFVQVATSGSLTITEFSAESTSSCIKTAAAA